MFSYGAVLGTAESVYGWELSGGVSLGPKETDITCWVRLLDFFWWVWGMISASFNFPGFQKVVLIMFSSWS